MNDRYQVYGADASGNDWIVAAYDRPEDALARVAMERARYPFLTSGRVHGVWDEQNPEVGDVEGRLEEQISDAKYDAWVAERKDANLCIRWHPEDGPVCVLPYDHLGPDVDAYGNSTISLAAGLIGMAGVPDVELPPVSREAPMTSSAMALLLSRERRS